MNVKELIDCLSKEVKKEDRANADISIFCGKQEYKIESIAGWGMSTDIDIHIEPIKSPIIRPMKFKKSLLPHVKRTMKKINKDLKK